MNDSKQKRRGPPSLEEIKSRVLRPQKVVVTGGMPYANGSIHIGHLAGAHIPPDIYARWMRMLIGKENVLFVCGTDDHGSTSELAAMRANVPTEEFVAKTREAQRASFSSYNISFDLYSGTSHPDCFPIHKDVVQEHIRALHKNGMLDKKISKQWFDSKLGRFLQDRFVSGECPKCANPSAYSDECDACGAQYDPSDLINPKSQLSDATPELKDTTHWWLNLWKKADLLAEWIDSNKKDWRNCVFRPARATVTPELKFSNQYEDTFKKIKSNLPQCKSRYGAGKMIIVGFESTAALEEGRAALEKEGVETSLEDAWAHRSISRDVAWGVPMPEDLDPEMKGKSFYVWPESLLAPIAFTKLALKNSGKDPESYRDFWCNPDAKIYQFIGTDNVYFYTLMQGALWLGSQKDPSSLPKEGDLQMSQVVANYHLQIEGEKMSKSKGNFLLADELLSEHDLSADQLRYFLSILSLHEKNSNFEFATLEERNRFLAGPLNAALEKPISACHSKFEGKVPQGQIDAKVQAETTKIIQRYIKAMDRVEYPQLLFAIENYARLINSMFTQHKPHDDRHPLEERQNALFSSFCVLKNILIMLYPFVPETMERLRESLNLDESVFSFEELGKPIAAGHAIGELKTFFPSVKEKG